MDFLKTLWPTPFKIERKNLSSFLIQLIIFIVVCAVVGVLIGVLSAIPRGLVIALNAIAEKNAQ